MPRRCEGPDHLSLARSLLDVVPETLAGGDVAEAERIARLAERIGRVAARFPAEAAASRNRTRALELRVARLEHCFEMMLASLAPDGVEDRPLPGEAEA